MVKGKVMIKWLFLLWPVVISTVHCWFQEPVQSETEDNLSAQLIEIFGTPPPPKDSKTLNNNVKSMTLDGEDCTCVPFYQCKNGTFVNNGDGIIELRMDNNVCDDNLEVCCNNQSLEKSVPKTVSGQRMCGFRNPKGILFRIFGESISNAAQFGEFPWTIAILSETVSKDGNVKTVYKCGGSLIHPKVVLTAAHSVARVNKAKLRARAGEWDFKTTNELFSHQDRKIQKKIIHNDFHAGSAQNDIALLILDEPFIQADNLGIICLPQQGDVILDKECYASGWGKDAYGKEGRFQEIMKQVKLNMVPHNFCQTALRNTRLGMRFNLHNSFVCAGGKDGDTCQGDGGSPLVCPVRSGKELQYQQVGIVSWGIGCGSEIPGVYVNVAHFITWIDQKMKNLKLEPNYHY